MSSAKRDENSEVALILQNLLGTATLYPTGISLTSATPLHVAMVDGNGDQLKGFGNIGLAPYDYAARVLTNATTVTWTFKSGGSGGTTTNTIVIVYTDSTLETISTVTKT